MVRTKQGGSILTFIIVGVVLAVLLIGGAYVIHRKTQVASESAPAPAPASAPQQDTSKKKDDSKHESTSDKTPSTKATTPEKHAAAQQPAPTSSASQLPQTGPVQTLSSMLALGLLGYVTTAYLRSRRARALALTSLL